MVRSGALWARLPVAMVVIALSVGSAAGGPIKTDGSVGPSAGEVKPVSTSNGPEYRIGPELGEQRGQNLFHSFERFGIPANETATFLGPASIDHLMARVTGSDPSDIEGTLRSTLPNADVWLINPNGVAFGKDARIDVPGALHVSTADELHLGEEGVFSAHDPAASILTSAPPEAFGLLGTGAQPGIRLQMNTMFGDGPDESRATAMVLVGGDVMVDRAAFESESAAPPSLSIVATQGPGTVRLDDVRTQAAPAIRAESGGTISVQGSLISLRNQQGTGDVVLAGGDVVIERNSIIDARGDLGGTIRITGSAVRIGGEPGDNSVAAVGGRAGMSGRAGPILIEGGTVRIVRGGVVRSTADLIGPANPITISGARIVIADGGAILSSAEVGKSARIDMVADRQLRVEGDPAAADVTGISTLASSGAGGNVTIRAPAGEVKIVSGAEIRTRAAKDARAGDLTIDARRLVISRQGSDRFTGLASSAGERSEIGGDAGAIVVRADSIEIGDLGAIASDSSGGGNAGSVAVDARRIELREGGQISSLTLPGAGSAGDSTGRGGSARVTARQSVTIAGEGPRPQEVRILEVDDDGQLRPVTRIIKPPSSITASSESPEGRRAGNVHVEAPVIRVSDRGEISSESFNEHPSGSVTVSAFDRLEIDNGEITSKATVANAGDIQITSGRLIDLHDDGEISTTVSELAGNAGEIDVTSPFIALNQSRIQANGEQGRGGDITIRSDALIQTPDSVIEALSKESVGGRVEVRRPDDPTSGVVALEASLEQRTELVADPCAIREDRPISAFVVREVYPDVPDPEQPLPAPREVAPFRLSARC